MANVLSMALIERNGRLLAVRKKDESGPFAGRWLLPTVEVPEDELVFVSPPLQFA